MLNLKKKLYYMIFAIVIYTLFNVFYYKFQPNETLKYVLPTQFFSFMMAIVFDILYDLMV